ncbi:MAG: four helix bundle protein [Caldilineaceae bacterium]|nr:four helix bundle protein [Caldilineaceae bacterium]
MAWGELEDLEIFGTAERICDRVYKLVAEWTDFDRRAIGSQMVRAADSIGANIAESYGRYHYGEQIQFLYYARGSIYELQFWLRRTGRRNLLPAETVANALDLLNELAAKLNAYIRSIRNKRKSSPHKLAEDSFPYDIDTPFNQ